MPRACVVGWPVAHSRSPLIHGHWLAEHGIAGTYERVAVPPEGLADFVAQLRAGAFAGANVTVPHKESVLALVDAADAIALAIGAANTLWRDGDRLLATNTDVHGFLASLDDQVSGWDARRDLAVVLGAGGAARAIVHGLRQRGFSRIAIANRTPARAASLGGDAAGWPPAADLLARADLLVNTTTLGMAGQPAAPVDPAALPRHAIVSDIVYAPLRTGLLAAAEARGLRVADGLGMLLHQAAPGFERWFGVRPDVTPALRARIAADITGD